MELHSTDLAITALAVAIPTMLYATVNRVDGCWLELVVYRSLVVRDDDPAYAPVADLLESHEVEVLEQERRQDEEMMFGRADYTVYRLTDGVP